MVVQYLTEPQDKAHSVGSKYLDNSLIDLSLPPARQMSFNQSAPAYKHITLDNPAGCSSTKVCQCNVNKIHAHAVFMNNDEAPGLESV